MEEKILYLTASGQSLQNNTKQVFASNTVKYVGAIFSLDENWQSMDTVRAIWHTDGEPISTVLDHDGYASIPPEMLDKVAPVMVNLVGSVTENNELKERLTTFPILALRVTADALINGGETAPITPSQFEQYVAVVKNDADRAEQAVEDVEQIKTDVIQLKEDTETLKGETAQLKADTAEIKTEVETLAEGFDETVAQAKSEIETLSTAEQGAISTLSANKKAEITQEGTTQKNSVTAEGTAQKGAITSLATDKLNAITNEGNTQVSRVTAEGNTQVSNVHTEGNTQVGLVQTEGEAQITEIQHIGAETIASIPKLAPVITDTVSGDIVSFTDGADGYPMKSVKVSLQPKQSGSGDPSPSNIRPISGYDGVEVNVSGVNILNTDLLTEDAGNFILNDNGVPVIDSASSYFLEPLMVKPSTRYYIYGNLITNGMQRVYFFDQSDNFISRTPTVTSPMEVDTPSNCYYIRFQFFRSYLDKSAWGVNYPSTETAYEPYHGQSHSISFKDSQGNPITVYGGNMNITDGEGDSKMGMNVIDGTQDISDNGTLPYGGKQIAYTPNPPKAFGDPLPNSDIMSDKFASGIRGAECEINGQTANRNVYFNMPSSVTTLAEAYQWFTDNPTTVIYKLATPTEIQLTPTEINTLLGSNTLWSDGAVECEYCADTKLYIDKKINALI